MYACSPKANKTRAKDDRTCFSLEALRHIAASYNAAGNGPAIPVSGTKAELWKAIMDRLNGVCGGDEACWLDQPWMDPQFAQEKKREVFRPPQPRVWSEKPNQWLNNEDIQKSMEQYNHAYPEFRFMGVFPVDFGSVIMGRCVSEQLCRLDIAALKRRGIRHIGAIFNMDRHNEPGSHWVGLYASWDPAAENYGVYYYDSVGFRPPAEIAAFMKSIRLQEASPKFKCHYNTGVRHQYGNTECGVFSMFFIIRCLKGHPFKEIMASDFKDKEVQHLRSILFRPVAPRSHII